MLCANVGENLGKLLEVPVAPVALDSAVLIHGEEDDSSVLFQPESSSDTVGGTKEWATETVSQDSACWECNDWVVEKCASLLPVVDARHI